MRIRIDTGVVGFFWRSPDTTNTLRNHILYGNYFKNVVYICFHDTKIDTIKYRTSSKLEIVLQFILPVFENKVILAYYYN